MVDRGSVALPSPSVGSLLQYWRKTRHLSQLGLATEADVSARHVCFLETGRAKPSREMILLLASVLEVPLRERNTLLLAAGFAPMYSEASLEAPELGAVRAALDAILLQQEPYPAVVMNRHWDILKTNAAAQRFFTHLIGEAITGPANVVRMIFDPKGLRPFVANWPAVAGELLHRVQREAVGGVKDDATAKLLESVLSFPDVPARLSKPRAEPLLPVIPVCFSKGSDRFSYFSTVTTLGTPQDITLQEIRIECFFPADPGTARLSKELAQLVASRAS
jgi:transcriptional regulator with XRE-family HTH domain